ncbi:MAG: tetratricopeptide repeat protein [Alphaproteobacteria bacterium]|jgi:tetratricopeptide (TPR) repeat protein|nr:tetratricopeptide repeat protein [Alphaproteobacteria bacterium]MDP6563790.1 tetratricopeptide repeat protein [Alphaproteobacteria bacterium]MDP6811773.1 tetratricopeptide repeat protein [Alphaproteobacteria bacterium]
MNPAEPASHTEPPEKPADPAAVYAPELEAACKNLGADASDLAHLLRFIHNKRVPRRQVPGLLKQAHIRLQKQRDLLADGTIPAPRNPELAAMIERVQSVLQPGAAFSPESASEDIEAACTGGIEHAEASDVIAALCGVQAGIAALRQDYRRAAEIYALAADTPELPPALQWRYQSDRAAVLEDLGREFGDGAALEEAIDLYENKLLDLAPQGERPDDWAATQNSLGRTLGLLGQRQRGPWMLERAVEAFQCALRERSRERAPRDWAETQNNLGNALGILAQRQGDVDLLEKAVAAFESALEVRRQDETSLDFATTQNNLGAALFSLGQRNKDARILKRSVDAYKEVLNVWTRAQAPLDWAMTMNNLGTAMQALGAYRKGPRTLEGSVGAFRSALAERTRERLPQDWAMTQNNLGAALQKLAERQAEPRILAEAVAAFESALEEWTRERAPINWAMTVANAGVARRTLAEWTQDAGTAEQAVSELEAATELFQQASHAQYYELALDQLAKARKLSEALRG